jgi:superfamily II DNA/RNA helicase
MPGAKRSSTDAAGQSHASKRAHLRAHDDDKEAEIESESGEEERESDSDSEDSSTTASDTDESEKGEKEREREKERREEDNDDDDDDDEGKERSSLQTTEGALAALGLDSIDALPALRAPGMALGEEENAKERWRQERERKRAARAPLPSWLAQPEAIDVSPQHRMAPCEAGLSPPVCRAFEAAGFESLFAVQAAVVPRVVRSSRSAYHPGDLCVSAPTGSGKTLAYVLPALDLLHLRVVRRLRVVVVVPTRQLAAQVHAVFETLLPLLNADKEDGARRVPLQAAIASGGTTLAREQAVICPTPDGVSPVDILVCTPGRLVEHLQNTPNFNLQFVRLLVIDEADRLLMQAFQGWLDILHLALYPRLENSEAGAGNTSAGGREQGGGAPGGAVSGGSWAGRGGAERGGGSRGGRANQSSLGKGEALATNGLDSLRQLNEDEEGAASEQLASAAAIAKESLLARAAARTQLVASATRLDPALTTAARHRHPGSHVQKLLFSATLSRDPERLLGLRLAYPSLLVATQSAVPLIGSAVTPGGGTETVVIPPQLDELFIECGPQEKPLVLLHCLLTMQMDRALVFTGDLDTTHRLATLLKLFGGLQVAEVSSETRSGMDRRAMRQVLRRFEAGELNVLVCSDSMARGVDLNNVENVISYDVPHTASSYIHRCAFENEEKEWRELLFFYFVFFPF